jgi:hypothetical protein
MRAIRRRLWAERFFWGRWLPLYLHLLARDTPLWTTVRLHGPAAGVDWLLIAGRTLYARRRQILREATS